jgi:uncharacterized protein
MTYSSPPPATRLGKGLRFPPLLPLPPGFAWVGEADAVDQAIRTILLTEPGERIGLPSFGVGLRRWLFNANTLELRTQITRAIEEALERDEQRIRLLEVEVGTDPGQPTVLIIAIHYEIRALPGARSLVFPFYLQEGAP